MSLSDDETPSKMLKTGKKLYGHIKGRGRTRASRRALQLKSNGKRPMG
jgi:hypothetical protein